MRAIFNIFVILFLGVFNFLFGQSDSLSLNEIDEVYPTKCFEKTKVSFAKKGAVFVFWGWNRSWFSKSDIHFKGEGYDFYLHDVVAHDRPTPISIEYLNPEYLSGPQFNFRAAYFIKDNLALVLAQDHMKYVMDQYQKVGFSGHISDIKYASKIKDGILDLSDAELLTFEHTDGLNYINLGIEKYNPVFWRKNFKIGWGYGVGLGALFPKSNVRLFGNERSDRYHLAGFGLDARTNINLLFWDHIITRAELKLGYINMPDIKTTLNNSPDKASQDFTFCQFNFGIGYLFNTKKKN